MRLLAAEPHWRVRRDSRRLDVEAGLVLTWPGRRVRLFAVWGTAPGSHMYGKHLTTWRTDMGPGQVHGWNLRAGWWPGPCLTMLAHTRPESAYDGRPGPVWALACCE